jgi:hypothetical protein
MAVTIKNFSFQPSPLTISVGTTVTWTNQDSVAHTSTSDNGVWDSGSIAPGASYSFTFNQAGSFAYHCAIHPNMHGMIIVQAAGTATSTSAPTATSTTAPAATSTSAPAATSTSAPAATSTPAAAAVTSTPIPLSAYPVYPSGAPALRMGAPQTIRQMSWAGYYDGHLNTYLSTDVSNKAQAAAMHINYAPGLAGLPMSATPAIYLVRGRAAANQLAVFGSEPGRSDYSPLWHEVAVSWKAGVKPVVLTSATQILNLARKGKLTVRQTHIVLNSPIVKVHK